MVMRKGPFSKRGQQRETPCKSFCKFLLTYDRKWSISPSSFFGSGRVDLVGSRVSWMVPPESLKCRTKPFTRDFRVDTTIAKSLLQTGKLNHD